MDGQEWDQIKYNEADNEDEENSGESAAEPTYCLGCMKLLKAEGPCEECQFDEIEYRNRMGSNMATLMPLGTLLNEGRYLVGKVLGFGGFSITYLALDLKRQLRVAVKEYMPRALAHRESDSPAIKPYDGDDALSFEYGLEQFLKEARILGHFNEQKGMVTVHNYFYANGTGYLIMDYLEGMTLKAYINALGRPMSWEEGLAFLMPVADVLEGLHARGLIHRDISPDNIFVSSAGEIKLLDFGAARLALGEYTKSLPVVLKAGFTPLEQYSGKGRQGPWTDLYALAATLYWLVTGKTLPSSTDRAMHDTVPGMVYKNENIPVAMKLILLKALALEVEARYLKIGDFRRDMSRGYIAVPGEFTMDEAAMEASAEDGSQGEAYDDGYEHVGGIMRKKTAASVDQEFLRIQNELLEREHIQHLKKLRRKKILLAVGLGLVLLSMTAMIAYVVLS